MDSDSHETIKLNLGCGRKYRRDYINVDIIPELEPDELLDLNGPWLWQDNTIDEILAEDVVEHLDDVVHFIEEAWRVLKPRGRLIIRTVYYTSVNYWIDPTHKRAFHECSFDYFDPSTEFGRMYGYYSHARFEIMQRFVDNEGNFNITLIRLGDEDRLTEL